MLGLGVVASLAIIWVTHNYGKFKISLNMERYRVLWYRQAECPSLWLHTQRRANVSSTIN